MTTTAYAQKNLALNPAAQDLGLGDQLQQELQNQLELRRKKMASAGINQQPSLLTGVASSDLFSIGNSGLGV